MTQENSPSSEQTGKLTREWSGNERRWAQSSHWWGCLRTCSRSPGSHSGIPERPEIEIGEERISWTQ